MNYSNETYEKEGVQSEELKKRNLKNDSSNLKNLFNVEKKNLKKQLKWSKNDDIKLINIVQSSQTDSKIKWNDVSEKFGNKTKSQCYSRYRQINPNIHKGAWSEKEKNLLSELVATHGKNWAKIAVLHKTRSGKQIRDHYNYCLNNKDNFTEDEDMKIKDLYMKYGNKFSKFTSEIPGRTSESIKNRFYSSIKRKITRPVSPVNINQGNFIYLFN